MKNLLTKTTKSFFLTTFLTLLFFIVAVEDVGAVTYWGTDPYLGTNVNSYTVNINKTIFSPGENIYLTSSLSTLIPIELLYYYSIYVTLQGNYAYLENMEDILSHPYNPNPVTLVHSGVLTAPMTPGAYVINLDSYYKRAGDPRCPAEDPDCLVNDLSPRFDGSSSILITVASPTGTVSVSSNISSSWTITGPATITGSGTSQTSTSKPTGTYTITWGNVAGYATPATETLTLSSGGMITFNGIYVATNIDLTAGSSYPVNVITDSPTLFYSAITNSGTGATGGSFPNFFQVATSTTGTITDLAPKTMPALGAGTSAVASSTTYTFTEGGMYYVRSCADKTASAGGGVITESPATAEDNNCGEWTSINVIETSLLPTVINATSTYIKATTATLGAEVTSFGAYSGELVEPYIEYTVPLATTNESLQANATSPDGKHFYVVTIGDVTNQRAGIYLYNRNESGELTYVSNYDIGNCTIGINNPITISPDGKNVYAGCSIAGGTGRYIVKYDRNINNGTLSNRIAYVTTDVAHEVIVSPDGSHLYTSADTSSMGKLRLRTRNLADGSLSNESNTIDISTMAAYARDIAFSSDGKSLYTANYESGAPPSRIWRFIRNQITGTISGRTFVFYPDAPRPTSMEVYVSPDDKYVYPFYDPDYLNIGGNIYNAVARFSRDTTTGLLSGGTSYNLGRNIDNIKISPDGNSVYGFGFGDLLSLDKIFVFRRGIADGSIDTTSPVYEHNRASASFTSGMQISPDGKSIYYQGGSPKNKIYLHKRTPPSISARGVCYGIMNNPSHTNGATCTPAPPATLGAYSINVTGLQQGTTYYVRGYATNSHGTGYSLEVSFTTARNGVCGSAEDTPSFTAPTSNLCSYGTPTAVTGAGTSQYYEWGCMAINNSGTGSNALCRVYNLSYITGVCGSAHGTPTPTVPTANLCTTTAGNSTPSDNGGTWMWTCSGSGGAGSASCSARSSVKIKYRMF